MSIQRKKYRRLSILLTVFLGFIVLGVAGYFLRHVQVAHQFAAYRRDAFQAAKDGKPEIAVDLLGKYFRRHNSDIEAFDTYSRQLQLLTDGDHTRDRIIILRRLLELDPARDDDRHTLLTLYVQAGFNTEADDLAQGILSKSPNDQEALRSRTIVSMRLRKFDDAMKAAAQFNSAYPQDLEGYALTLTAMHLKGTPATQIVGYADKLLQSHPKDPCFELVKSFAFDIAEDPQASVTWARKAAAHAPVDPTFIDALAKQLESLAGKLLDSTQSTALYSESTSIIERAFKTKPSDEDLRHLLTARYFEINHWKDVLALTADTHPHPANSIETDLLAFRALSLMQNGSAKDAQPVIENLSSDKKNPNAILWSGVLKAIDSGDPQKSIDACRKALSHTPGSPYFHFFLAKAYLKIAENELAINNYKAAASLAPGWNLPLVEVSRLLTSAGQGQNALAVANKALERNPDDTQTLVAVALAMATTIPLDQADKHPELLDLLERIQRQTPGEEQTLPLQVLMLAQSGQRDRSIAIVDKTLSASKPPSEAALLQLSATAHEIDPKLQEKILARSREIYGVTPDLTMTMARNLLNAGKPKDGLKLIEDAKAGPHAGDELSWEIVHARYLDFIEDAHAKDEWVAVGDKNPDNMQVQWLAISARSVQADHAFIGRTIDRLQKLVGNQGTGWRLARARWLLSGGGTAQETTEATALLNEVSRTSPDLLAPRLLLAECLERSNNISGAVDQLMAAVAISPQSKGIALELVRLLQQQGDYDRARPYLDRVLESKSLTATELRRVAILLAQDNESDRALKLFKAAFGSDPAQQPPDIVLAGLYRMQNQPARAEEIYKKLLEKPDTSRIAVAAGFYAETGRLKEAERILSMLDKVEPSVPTRELILGDFYLQHGTAETAVAHYKNAANADQKNLVAWRRIINFSLAANKPDEAFAAAKIANSAVPDDALLAQFIRREKEIREALPDASARSFLLSLLHSPTDSAASYEVIDVLNEARRNNAPFEQTLTKMRTLADRYGRLLPLQSWIAQAYAVMKDYDDAVNIGTRTMRTFPTSPEPAEISAGALAAAGRWNEVLQVAKDWRQRIANNPLPADEMIAAAHLGLGDPKAAQQQLQPYLKAATDAPDSYAMLLSLYTRGYGGDVKSAADFLRPLLPKSGAMQSFWIKLAAVQIRDPKDASNWLNEIEPLVASKAFSAKLTIAVGWQQLALRSRDAQVLQTAKDKLAALLAESQSAKDVTPVDLQAMGVLEETFNATDAENLYRRALKIKPDLAIAQNNLAMLLLRKGGDLTEALNLAAEAVKNNPKVANFADTLASVYEQSKTYDRAVASMKTAIHLEPENIEWQLHLIEILTSSGNLGDAKTNFSKLTDTLNSGRTPTSVQQQRILAIQKQLNIKT